MSSSSQAFQYLTKDYVLKVLTVTANSSEESPFQKIYFKIDNKPSYDDNESEEKQNAQDPNRQPHSENSVSRVRQRSSSYYTRNTLKLIKMNQNEEIGKLHDLMVRVFNNLHPSYFDERIEHPIILQHSFQNFNNPPSVVEVEFWKENLEEIAKLIQRKLNQNALDHYQSFSEGLDLIERISSLDESSLEQVSRQRQSLNSLKFQVVGKARNIFSLLNRKRKLEVNIN